MRESEQIAHPLLKGNWKKRSGSSGFSGFRFWPGPAILPESAVSAVTWYFYPLDNLIFSF